MKLLIVTQVVDKTHPILGFFHRWLEVFASQTEQLTVICLQKGEVTLPDNVRVISLGKEEGKGRMTYLWRFFSTIIKERHAYDVVFVHMNQIYVVLAGLLWRLMRKRIGLWYTHKQVSCSLRIATLLSHSIFTASEASFLLQTKKKQVMGHGIDMEQFKAVTKDASPKAYKQIIQVARIMPSKRQKEVVQAFATIHAAIPDSRLTLIGPTADEAYVQEVKQEITTKQLEDVVTIVGPKSHGELPPLYRSADLVLNASITGSMDKDVLEAIVSGTPVITTNIAFSSLLAHNGSVSDIPHMTELAITQLTDGGLVPPTAAVRQTHDITHLIPRLLQELIG